MKFGRLCFFVLCASGYLTGALAHHSYAMFDARAPLVVAGSLAKLEWMNPHSFVWIYVKKTDAAAGFDLWTFESDAVGVLERNGWTKDAVKPGERVTIQYFPLRDGRKGGYMIRLVRADGKELVGDKHAPGVANALAQGPLPQRGVAP